MSQKEINNNIIFNISSIIHDDDIDMLKEYLLVIPIDKFGRLFRTTILHDLLVECYDYDRPEMAKTILDYFSSPYYNIEDFAPAPPMSLYTSLYLESQFNSNLLIFISQQYSQYSFVRCIDELSFIDNNPSIPMAINKLFNVYGEYPLNALLNILDGIPKTQVLIRNVLRDKIRKVNNYADLPPYMVSTSILVSESMIDYSEIQGRMYKYKNILPPIDELARMIYNSMVSYGFMYENEQILIEKLIFILASVPYEKKVIMAEQAIGQLSHMDKKDRDQYKYNIDYDKMIFRLFGPANPFYSLTNTEGIDLMSPRMLEYTDGEITEDPTGETDAQTISSDWFTGSCMQCDLRIRRRWHAIRIPYSFGSWKGCYCSWSCAHDYLLHNYENPKYELILVEIYRELFEDPNSGYDILDRVPDNEYNKYLSKISKNTNTTNVVIKDNISHNIPRLDKVVHGDNTDSLKYITNELPLAIAL
uniref:Putative transmembrane protein n=1 Tax=Pithovirus LCPAC101 TaxID=2506586 RepID=A0A481Z242_9VIRU|nr:MAG: putative transmembrane protein [Pithovirus LCPAC101]